MATTLLPALRALQYRDLDIGEIVENALITALAAGSFTSPYYLQHSRWGGNQRSGATIFRPAAANANDKERTGNLITNSSGLFAHDGLNWTDTTLGTETVELLRHGLSALRDVHGAFNAALRLIPHFTSYIMISHLTGQSGGADLDGAMASTGVTNWSAVGTPATGPVKSTTEDRTPWGLRSLRVLNNEADEGAQSATIPCTVGAKFNAFVIHSAAVGTGRFILYNASGLAEINSAGRVDNAEEEPQLLCRRNEVSAGNLLALQLVGTTTTSDNYWNQAGIYKHDNLIVRLPSFITEEFQTFEVCQGIPQDRTAENVWNAQSLKMDALVKGRDYTVLTNQADANPNAVRFKSPSFYEYPIFARITLPWSYFGDLSAETDSTKAPLRVLLPAANMELLKILRLRAPNMKDTWDGLYNAEYAKWLAAIGSRSIQVETSPEYFSGPDRLL